MRPFCVASICLLTWVVVALSGCGNNSSDNSQPLVITEPPPSVGDSEDVHITADDVERPADFDAGVQRIIAYRDTIRDQIAVGHPGDAHRPLDEATFVLDWMPELARDSGVPKDHWEAANLSTQGIRSLFDQIHAQIDNNEEPDFESVAAGIQEAIDALSSISDGTPDVVGSDP
jgi:ABC-type Fe3+-hydroxamate transport system substrate-binding protein